MSKRRARASKTPFVMVSAKLKSSLGLGHPWVYGDVESGERWAVLKTYAASLERIVPWVVEA
ncbi:MAG TPA: hypothetical protein G4N94_13765, partial [Caldilineae bacterium]|nr:hypothetical protein [Caldilineae bacterium]